MANIKFNKTQTNDLNKFYYGRLDWRYNDVYKNAPKTITEFVGCFATVLTRNECNHSKAYYYNNNLRLVVYHSRGYFNASPEMILNFKFDDTGYTVDVTNTVNVQAMVAKVNKIVPNYCVLTGNTLRVNGFAHIEMKLLIAAFRRYTDIYKVCEHNIENYEPTNKHCVDVESEEYASLIGGVNAIIKQMTAANNKILGKKMAGLVEVTLRSISCNACMFGKTFYEAYINLYNDGTGHNASVTIAIVVENGVASWRMSKLVKHALITVFMEYGHKYEFLKNNGYKLYPNIELFVRMNNCCNVTKDEDYANSYEELLTETKKVYTIMDVLAVALEKIKK